MLWRISKSDITKALYKLFGAEVKSFYLPSGLYLWATLYNGEIITVLDYQIQNAL